MLPPKDGRTILPAMPEKKKKKRKTNKGAITTKYGQAKIYATDEVLKDSEYFDCSGLITTAFSSIAFEQATLYNGDTLKYSTTITFDSATPNWTELDESFED